MEPKKSLSESYQLFFQNLFNFNGRTRRSDYWPIVIINSIVVSAITSILTAAVGKESAIASIISSILSLALTVLELGLVVRRLHDAGKEWTYLLLALIPLVGWIIVIIALLKDSEPGDNQYGPNPKGVGFVAPAGAQPQDPVYAPVPPVQDFNAPVAPDFGAPAEPAAPVADFSAPAEPVAPVADFSAPAEPVAPVADFSAPAEPAAPAAASFCTACGAPIPEGSNNCPSCGNQV